MSIRSRVFPFYISLTLFDTNFFNFTRINYELKYKKKDGYIKKMIKISKN